MPESAYLGICLFIILLFLLVTLFLIMWNGVINKGNGRSAEQEVEELWNRIHSSRFWDE